MASSIKILLRNKPNKEGAFPLTIRITHNRKSTFIYTGHYLAKKHWDETNNKVRKSHPNSTRLNNLLIKKLAEANQKLIDLESDEKVVSSKQIKKEITNAFNDKSFNSVSKRYLIELEENNKLSRLSSDKARVKHVLDFSKSKNLSFKEIDEDFLNRFIAYMKWSKKNSNRSVINTLIVVRTLYNRAIKEGIVDRKLYPFGADKIRIKFPETKKIGLSVEEVKKIDSAKNLTEQENHARNVWFFSFYLAGMRVGDVLQIRWSDIYDGRLHYRMNKNDKLLSLKLPDKIFPILNLYKHDKKSPKDFVFPELKKANLKSPKDILAKTKTANKKFNNYLSDIAEKIELDKKLTMHIARHTFGNISGDKIPIQTLQKLYRHSSITTTINYQANFIHKDFDEALDSVVNF